MDERTEVIQRLTRVETQLESLIESFEKLQTRLVGESGVNGLIGGLTLRVVALEGTAKALGAGGSVISRLISYGGWLITAGWAVYTHFKKGG